MGLLREVYYMYTPRERRNIAIYIAGIMLYKMGLEFVRTTRLEMFSFRLRSAPSVQREHHHTCYRSISSRIARECLWKGWGAGRAEPGHAMYAFATPDRQVPLC